MKYQICPFCGRSVRVLDAGRLYKHLMKLANKSRGSTQCPNRYRDLPDSIRRYNEDGMRI